jgi:hypothetical protein
MSGRVQRYGRVLRRPIDGPPSRNPQFSGVPYISLPISDCRRRPSETQIFSPKTARSSQALGQGSPRTRSSRSPSLIRGRFSAVTLWYSTYMSLGGQLEQGFDKANIGLSSSFSDSLNHFPITYSIALPRFEVKTGNYGAATLFSKSWGWGLRSGAIIMAEMWPEVGPRYHLIVQYNSEFFLVSHSNEGATLLECPSQRRSLHKPAGLWG